MIDVTYTLPLGQENSFALALAFRFTYEKLVFIEDSKFFEFIKLCW